MVAMSTEAAGEQTLRERQEHDARERRDTAAGHPAVKALMTAFPGARIVDVRSRAAATDSPADFDPGLAASLESGEGLHDPGLDPSDESDGLDDLNF
jgi:DNA polymerase-3 subunit gamma/tau